MKKKMKSVFIFLTDVISIYIVLVLALFCIEVLFEIPLVGIPILIISTAIKVIEKLKERD